MCSSHTERAINIGSYMATKKRRKLKLVLSDLHLGKGMRLPNGAINFLEGFYYDDQFVEFIHYYSSGVYRHHDIELIINGDFFDFLQVDYKELSFNSSYRKR